MTSVIFIPSFLSRCSHQCHCQLWASYTLSLLLHTMPPFCLFCPAYPSRRVVCNHPVGHSSHRTQPTGFHLCQSCHICGTRPKPRAPLVCSPCCTNQCRNISGVVLCNQHSQHFVKQIKGSHQLFFLQILVHHFIAHQWRACFCPFLPSKLL